MRVIAVIPAYNESATIVNVVKGLGGIVDEVVVVDDCSKDATASLAESAGAYVVRNATNKGYDGSIDAGFKEAAKRNAEVIVTCDADGQHRAEDVRAVSQAVVRGEADVAVGQRQHITRLGEKIFAIYTRLKFGIGDPLCGLKAYRHDVYDTVGHFDTLGSIGTQLMAEAWLHGYHIVKVPVTVLPRPDESRFYARLWRANMKILAAAHKIIRLTIWKTPQL